MAYSRNSRRRLFKNNNLNYRNVFFRPRGIKETMQYGLPTLRYPSPTAILNLENVTAYWGSTDKLYNIASEYYGSPEYWWVIAWYNQKTTEADFSPGEVYLIPLPLEAVLAAL